MGLIGQTETLLKDTGDKWRRGRASLSLPKEPEKDMDIHLCCPCCPCRFSSAPDASADEVLDRMNGDAPWFALAEGETFEDMVFAALEARGRILCPDCRAEVLVGGESLPIALGNRGPTFPPLGPWNSADEP